jgi:predicted nucleotidyltransferase
MTHNQIREKISHSIHANDPGAIAYLFGSRARGDFRPDSDWDILILVDNAEFSNSIDDVFRDDLYNIELDTGQIISTLIYPKEYWKTILKYSPLYKNITSEGILL